MSAIIAFGCLCLCHTVSINSCKPGQEPSKCQRHRRSGIKDTYNTWVQGWESSEYDSTIPMPCLMLRKVSGLLRLK
ncbi:hypothetical protein F4815DRAFT_459835 [Daldinia loculata]|nr:hypothetical protein F4815DRAFT_459835 [Daldinia loculata]